MEELVNEKEYLKLNIMELEDEIASLEDKERKYQIEIKELKKNQCSHDTHSSQDPNSTHTIETDFVYSNLVTIKDQL